MGFFGSLGNLINPIQGFWNLFKGFKDAGNDFTSSLRNLGAQISNIDKSNPLEEWIAGASGTRLTNAQQQANAFTAEREDIAWQRQMDASNTEIQRRVADMQSAGLNPVLAAGNGASTPTASSSPSASPGTPNLGAVLSLLPQMMLAKAQAADLDASAKLKLAEANKSAKQTEEIGYSIQSLVQQIEGSKLDNANKRVVNRYLERQQEAELRVKESSAESLEAQASYFYRSVSKMDVEELSIFINCCDTAEHINYLRSLENLNDSQINELNASIKKLNAETKLINLNIDNFDDITVVGSTSTNFGLGPVKAGESHPMTLGDIKRHAEKVRSDKEQQHMNNVGRNSINGERIYD